MNNQEQPKQPKGGPAVAAAKVRNLQGAETLRELNSSKEETPLPQSYILQGDQYQAETKKSSSQKDQGSFTAAKGSNSSGTTPKGREGDYYKFFRERFGPLVVLILWVAMADLEKATFYAPAPDECEELAPHAARLFTRLEDALHLPKWAHSALTNSDDVISIGLILVGYLDRIGVLKTLMPYFLNSAKPKVTVNGFKQDNGPIQQPATNGNRNTNPIPFGIGFQNLDTI